MSIHRRCAEKQPRKAGLTMCSREFVTRDTGKCPLSILTAVSVLSGLILEKLFIYTVRYMRVSVERGSTVERKHCLSTVVVFSTFNSQTYL